MEMDGKGIFVRTEDYCEWRRDNNTPHKTSDVIITEAMLYLCIKND